MFAPYRIRLDRKATARTGVVIAKFKFPITVWVPGFDTPVIVPAALDTFADSSMLPEDTFRGQGGIVPPVYTPPSGHASAVGELDFAFPLAPPPIRQFRFPADPCRYVFRGSPGDRFRLSLRDLIARFRLEFEYDKNRHLCLLLHLLQPNDGQVIP